MKCKIFCFTGVNQPKCEENINEWLKKNQLVKDHIVSITHCSSENYTEIVIFYA